MSFDPTRLPNLFMMLKTYSTISSMKRQSFSSPDYVISKLEVKLPKLAVEVLDSEAKPICRIRFDDWNFTFTYKPYSLKYSMEGSVREMALTDDSQEDKNHPMHMLVNTSDVSRFNTELPSSNTKSPAFEFECTFTEADPTIESNINKSKYASAQINLRAAPFYIIFNRRTVARLITAYTFRDFYQTTKVRSIPRSHVFRRTMK